MPNPMATLNQSVILMIVTLLVFGLRPAWSSCDSDCDAANPDVVALRAYWSESYTTVDGQNLTFEQFLLSLVQETDDPQAAADMMSAIELYKDCVIACQYR